MDALADTTVAVLVFATLAAAWSWLGAYAGVVSFGHAVFFGIGAYAVAVSNVRGGSPWYGALGGALFAVVVAAGCGLLCLRGRGYAFTFVSLAAAVAAAPFAAAHDWVGPHDAFAFPAHTGFLNLQFVQKWPYMLLALAVFAVVQALTFALRSSRLGYYLRALRTGPSAARSVGVRALPARLAVLAASAFVTSVAGSFSAEYTLHVAPDPAFGLALSFDIALIGAFGGAQSPWGPLLAGLGYALLARSMTLHPPGLAGTAVLVVEGMVIVLVTLVRPRGAFGARPRRSTPAVARGAG